MRQLHGMTRVEGQPPDVFMAQGNQRRDEFVHTVEEWRTGRISEVEVTTRNMNPSRVAMGFG